MHRVNAKDLKHNKHQLMKIDRNIREILSTIDDEIKDAHDAGKINIKYPIPYAFNIENLKSNEARRRIHSHIISDLASRGFIVYYTKEMKKYYLLITWITEAEKYKKEAEIDILKYYQLPENERNSMPPPNISGYSGVKSLV